jgi:hypothetical protein
MKKKTRAAAVKGPQKIHVDEPRSLWPGFCFALSTVDRFLSNRKIKGLAVGVRGLLGLRCTSVRAGRKLIFFE